MTLLERLIQEQATRAFVGTISVAVEKMAAELAREVLEDEAFRAEFKALVRDQAKTIATQLSAPVSDDSPPHP